MPQIIPLIRAIIGYPPPGTRQPGVGDGYTGSKVGKIKVKNVKPKGRHAK